jgi:hypothetical protein
MRILKSSEMLRRVHWYIRSSYQRSEGACNAFVFRVNVRSSLSLSVLGLLDYDDEGTTLLQNVGSCRHGVTSRKTLSSDNDLSLTISKNGGKFLQVFLHDSSYKLKRSSGVSRCQHLT